VCCAYQVSGRKVSRSAYHSKVSDAMDAHCLGFLTLVADYLTSEMMYAHLWTMYHAVGIPSAQIPSICSQDKTAVRVLVGQWLECLGCPTIERTVCD
jgi:hypothetical protein